MSPTERRAVIDAPSLFYDRAQPAALRLAVAMVDHLPIAEDIVQDAFAEMWLRWSRIEQPDAYLRTCVVNRCRKELRRRAIRRRPVAPPTIESITADDMPELTEHIRALSPRRRAVAVLRFYEDLSIAQIAQTLGVRPGTVKATLHQALSQLREGVER